MTTGDVNCAIVFDAGGYNLIGATCAAIAAPGREPNAVGAAITLSPLVVQPDGRTAVYYTTGTDFQQGGPWSAALKTQRPDGEEYTSPAAFFYIFPLL